MEFVIELIDIDLNWNAQSYLSLFEFGTYYEKHKLFYIEWEPRMGNIIILTIFGFNII